MILEYKVKKEDTYNLGRVAGTPMFDSNGWTGGRDTNV